MFEMINKLRDRDKKNDKQEAKLYGDNGVEINENLIPEKMKEYWTDIYRKHENKIDSEWNMKIKIYARNDNVQRNCIINFNTQHNAEYTEIPDHLREHL